MTLGAIIAATLAAGIGSVWLAEMLLRLGLGGGGRIGPQHLLSLAAGALLATAFMHLLPEAFQGEARAQPLFATLLVGLVFFFLLEKAELWHHGHEHGAEFLHGGSTDARGHGHHHHHHHDHEHSHGPAPGGWSLLTGDSVHCFGDGVLIASAFMADMRLGVVAALSVLAHEIPHHVGDLIVLRQRGAARSMAVVKVSLAGAVSVLGGLVGYFLVGRWHGALPYFLVIASSSFIYVALADLIPQLQRRLPAAQALAQVFWLAAGIVAVTLVSALSHGLEH